MAMKDIRQGRIRFLLGCIPSLAFNFNIFNEINQK